jgi:hypothetical protein
VHSGRELVRAALAAAKDPVRDTIRDLVPILMVLPGTDARALAAQAEREMTRQGWNPKGAFTETLRQAIVVAAAQQRDIAAPHCRRLAPPPADHSPGLQAGPAAYP